MTTKRKDDDDPKDGKNNRNKYEQRGEVTSNEGEDRTREVKQAAREFIDRMDRSGPKYSNIINAVVKDIGGNPSASRETALDTTD